MTYIAGSQLPSLRKGTDDVSSSPMQDSDPKPWGEKDTMEQRWRSFWEYFARIFSGCGYSVIKNHRTTCMEFILIQTWYTACIPSIFFKRKHLSVFHITSCSAINADKSSVNFGLPLKFTSWILHYICIQIYNGI